MFIVEVHHRFTGSRDRVRAGPRISSPRTGLRPACWPGSSIPVGDKADAFCLWEGKSLEEVRDYVDATLGDASRNEYWEVDAEIARGLPELAVSRA